jgi:hypothetical protein
MISPLFRIGTLALLIAAIAPASVSHRYARSEQRDQGRPHSRHGANYCYTCERTPSGRIRRNSAARRVFGRLNSCPSTGATAGACPGYVIDHIVPLKRGGADAPENMQWQTVQDAKAKDRVE